MRSRFWCASFSRRWKSCIRSGPRGPALSEFWLSPTGAPPAVVIVGLLSAIGSLRALRDAWGLVIAALPRRHFAIGAHRYILPFQSENLIDGSAVVSFKQLRYFDAVARLGHFGRAA